MVSQIIQSQVPTSRFSDDHSNLGFPKLHLRMVQGSSSSSQVHRHQRRSSQLEKRTFLRSYGMASIAEAPRRKRERQTGRSVRFGERPSSHVAETLLPDSNAHPYFCDPNNSLSLRIWNILLVFIRNNGDIEVPRLNTYNLAYQQRWTFLGNPSIREKYQRH